MNSSPTITSEFTTASDRSVEYQFEIFRGRDGLASIRDDWNQIAQESDKLRFFQCYEWYESYLDTLAEAYSPVYFVLVRQQSSPVGVIPLMRSIRKIAGLRFRSLELINHSHMPLSDGVFARSDSDGAILQGLLWRLQRQSEIKWDLVCFTNLLEDGCIKRALESSPIPRLISEARTRCNYISCIPFDELSNKFSKNFRGNLRKARNKLMNLSGVEYISVRRQPQLDQALDEFLEVEASGWKGAMSEQTAIKLDLRLTNFYRSLSETFSPVDACEINLLKADGRCLAGQFCLVVGDTSYILKIGYDESYVQLAPGNMLLESSLRRYWREGVVKYLNLVTDTPWHSNWNPLSYTVSNAYVFNATPTGLAAFALLRFEKYLSGKYKAQLKPLVERWRNLRNGHTRNEGSGGNKSGAQGGRMSETNSLRERRGLVNAPAGSSVLSESPFKIKNSLAGHPLFEDSRLKRLLRTLPREHIEIRAVQSLDTNDGGYRRGERLTDADPVETFEQLGEKPSWMLLHESWIHDPEYGELMRQYVRDLAETVSDIGGDPSDLGCWLFFSSGRCVVHFHADPDQSFLNQIRGSKTIYVYPAKTIPEPAVEKLVYTHNQGAVTYQPEYETSLFPPVQMVPGETVFLPLFAPHRVINDDDICVSFNVGFHTRESRRRRAVHIVNLEMRRLGLQPAPYDQRPGIDSIKNQMYQALRVRNKFFKFLKPEVPV